MRTLILFLLMTTVCMGAASSEFSSDNREWYETSDTAVLDITDEITMAAWVYPTDLASTENRGVIAKYRDESPHTDQRSYELVVVQDGDNVNCSISDDGTFNSSGSLTSAGTVNLNEWQFIACTIDTGSFQRIYIGGSLDTEDTTGILSSIHSGSAPLEIGNQFTTGAGNTERHWAGNLAYAHLYNRALNEVELNEIMHKPCCSVPDGLVVCAPLLTAGSTEEDWSENSLSFTEDGTITPSADGPPVSFCGGMN